MKLRNKKTGEIADFRYLQCDYIAPLVLTTYENDKPKMYRYNSLAELNAEWEDAPEEPKEWYWFIEDNGVIQRSCHYEDLHPTLDKARKEIGNYFNTREEAEKAVEKLKAWKLLKDECDIKFDGLIRDDRAMLKGVKLTYDRHGVTFNRGRECIEALYLLFGGEE